MKKLSLSILLCLIVLTVAQVCSAADTKEEKGYISLSGFMEREVEPNVARVTFSVVTTDKEVKKASEENNIITNKIITALKEITNEETDKIKTINFSVNPVYETQANSKREIINYTVNNSVSVETKNVKSVSKLIDTALANGANRFNGLSFSFENDKTACNEMYPIVLKDMRSEADIIAKAAGTTVSKVKQINASCSTNMSYSNRMVYAAKSNGVTMDSASSTPIESGKVKVSVRVNADFFVK